MFPRKWCQNARQSKASAIVEIPDKRNLCFQNTVVRIVFVNSGCSTLFYFCAILEMLELFHVCLKGDMVR